MLRRDNHLPVAGHLWVLPVGTQRRERAKTENPARIQKSPTWEIAPDLQERVDRRRKMPRSQPSPVASPPLSPSVSPASADRGRKKSGSGHRRRGSWSLERPRAHSFDAAEGNLDDSDSDLNTLPTPARKQRRSTGRVRRFLRACPASRFLRRRGVGVTRISRRPRGERRQGRLQGHEAQRRPLRPLPHEALQAQAQQGGRGRGESR